MNQTIMKNTNVSFGKRIQMIWKEFSNNLKKKIPKRAFGVKQKSAEISKNANEGLLAQKEAG